MIRVAALDDHPLITQMISDALQRHPDLQLVGTAAHGRDLMPLVHRTRPDVLILDLRMDDGVFEPAAAVRILKRAYPHIQVLVLTGDVDQGAMRTLVQAGVLGYVLKSDPLSLRIPEGVRAVHNGRRFVSESVIDALFLIPTQAENPLTNQELTVLRLLAAGASNRGISQALGLSYGRVRNILSEMYSKAGIRSGGSLTQRDALLAWARRSGLLDGGEEP